MVRTPDARLAANARRFQTRRLVHALVCHETDIFDEPVRAQVISLSIGWLAAGLALVVGAVLTLVVPGDSTGDAPIVMDRDSGALYVRVGVRLHPVPNLASARLVAHAPTDPVAVTASAIAAAERGPALGITGAPAHIGMSAHPMLWSACEGVGTVVRAGGPELIGAGPAVVLATPAGESTAVTYLLYDGRRAEVDLRDIAAVRALRLDGVAARPLSRTLLDLLPESPPITAPVIPGLGGPAVAGWRVGQVLRLARAGSTEYYVALTRGMQRVGEVAADLIRFRYGVGGGEIPDLAPDIVAAAPVVEELAVAGFPAVARPPLGGAERPEVCVQWRTHGSDPVEITVRTIGPDAGPTRALAQADGSGPHVDAVGLPNGQSSYVRAAGVLGDTTGGALYLITDAGVRHGIADAQTAGYLGLTGDPVGAPWAVLAQLPQGPELAVEHAELQRDAGGS